LAEIGIKKIFLINLDRRIDRLSHVLQLLGYLRLPCTRFSAIEAREISEQMNKFDPRTKFIQNISSISLTGLQAIWLSHLQILFKIVDEASENDRPVLIFEDDIDMEANTPSLLKETLNILPNDWEIFLLGHCVTNCKQVYANNICRVNGFYCIHAYVIRNSTVAKKLISWSNTKTAQVADIYWLQHVEKGSLVVYGAYPSLLVTQDRDKFGKLPESGNIPAMKLRNSLSKMIQ
jgi:GR25 family glycosyltransferase involved in LPS biosynthesis